MKKKQLKVGMRIYWRHKGDTAYISGDMVSKIDGDIVEICDEGEYDKYLKKPKLYANTTHVDKKEIEWKERKK